MFNENPNIISFHQQEVVHDTVLDIIDGLDANAINQFFDITGDDQSTILKNLFNVTSNVIYGDKSKVISNQFMYMDKFTERVDVMLKKLVLSYFIITTMPLFEMSWHHLEWGSLVQQHRYLVIIAARGHGKTWKKDTLIPMYDGSLKKVQGIKVGDKVMGVDSTVRTVKETHVVEDTGYEIPAHYQQALSYTVSKDHILRFQHDTWRFEKGKRVERIPKITEMSADEFYHKPDRYKSLSWGYRVNGWDLQEKELPIEPYLLGLWLGDGTASLPNITNIDTEVIDYLEDFCKKNGFQYSYRDKKTFRIKKNGGKRNMFFDTLRELNLIKNKHIPEIYFQASRRQRLELLAGFIDTGGYYNKHKAFRITQKHEHLIDELQRLAWSLGFRAKKRKDVKFSKIIGENYTAYDLDINGEIWSIPTKIKRKQAEFVNRVQDTHRYSIKNIKPVEEQLFYGFEVDKDHLHLLEDGTVVHNSFFYSKAVPLWHLYRYNRDDIDTNRKYGMNLSRKGVLITAEYKLATGFMEEIIEEIETNELLRDSIYPDKMKRGVKWGAEHISTKGGAQLEIRSYGSKMRGLHPGWIIVDDMLTDQVMYSADQREKTKTFFHSVIINLLEPGGQIVVVGTPFHQEDLYADLKSKKGWAVFEYPAIFPNGRVLWEGKYPLPRLEERLETIGSLNFSREILVRPVSGESSIFPYEIIKRSFDKTISLIPNVVSTNDKFDQIVIGTDFAISSSASADSTAFVVLGVTGEMYRILEIFVEKGMSYDAQMNQLKRLNQAFMPDKIIIESNAMQKIFFQMAVDMGLPVLQHATGREKWSLENGLPALSVLFESHKMRLPYGDKRSKDLIELLAGELSSYTYDSGKILTTSGHSDVGMALWQSVFGVKYSGTGFNFSFI